MKLCSAPCIGVISEEDYHTQVERAVTLLKGKGGELLTALRSEMAEYSVSQDDERAILLRRLARSST